MPQFQKKPVIVDAVQFLPISIHSKTLPEGVIGIPSPCADNWAYEGCKFYFNDIFRTEICNGDWIVNKSGKFSIYKDASFKEEFEYADIFLQLESMNFYININIASSLSVLIKAIEQNSYWQALKYKEDQEIVDRIKYLSATHAGYETPEDSALAAYIHYLNKKESSLLQDALKIIWDMPNLFWTDKICSGSSWPATISPKTNFSAI